MRQKSIKIITFLMIIAIVIGYFSINYYKTRIPSGILWSKGISSKEVKLDFEAGRYFRYYLYKKNGKDKGIITLQRRNESNFWSLYSENKIEYNLQESPEIEIAQASYPTYQENGLAVTPVWGGVVKFGGANSFSIHSKDKVYSPNTTVEIDGKTYFFFSSPDLTVEDEIEISKP